MRLTGGRFLRRAFGGAVLVAFVAASPVLTASAQSTRLPPEGEGRHWAVLIGVEEYQKAAHLRHTINDVEQLAVTLTSRAGFEPAKVVTFLETHKETAAQPLKASLEAELGKWLKKPAPKDDVFLYFTGHGYRDKDGALYLAPLDCDPKHLGETAISVAWLREQLAGCRAGFKLLILDACHAGSEKGEDEDLSVPTKDLGEPFRDVEGVVTLASSTADEKSLPWEDRQMSLFTYWLNQALKGHADVDGDGIVDFSELHKYVHRNVTQTAQARFKRSQTPVPFMRGFPSGVPAVVRLHPSKLNQLLADMAEQIALALEFKGVKKVGVLFTAETAVSEAARGTFGRSCALKLQDQLMQAGANKFSVVDGDRLIKTLKDSGFSVESLGTREAMEEIARKMEGLEIIARVTLRQRFRQVASLHCNLLQTGTADLLASAGGSAWLNEAEWGMLGHSIAIKNEERPPPGDDEQELLFTGLDERAKGSHPLADDKFPFRVSVYVGGKEQKGAFKGNELFVPVRAGQKFEIWVENKSKKRYLMRLLVDGLNTLPEPDTGKGVQTFITAKPQKLDEARAWILDPAVGDLFRIPGFAAKTGTDGEFRHFEVVDASQSRAAQLGFTEQIGVITAAFYEPVGPRSATVGVIPGAIEQAFIPVIEGIRPGNQIAVLTIHYGEP